MVVADSVCFTLINSTSTV